MSDPTRPAADIETATLGKLAAARPRLVVLVSGPGGVEARVLDEDRTFIVGRAPECDIVVDDVSVSRRHVSLRVERGDVRVGDLGSKNGVSVRGRRVPKDGEAVVRAGEVILIGAITASVVLESALDPVEGSAAAPITGEVRRTGGGIFVSPAMKRLVALLERVAKSQLSVLLTGESGSGKEVLARIVHDASGRRARAYVPVNCAALPESMAEAELFGFAKGAFTGALKDKPGLFEAASGGTLFLDEVGELPLPLQAKLLRVLETGKVRRLGELEESAVDVRIVSATNVDLERAVANGRFRADLLYRLNGMSFSIPPLRERKEDIAPLARMFAETGQPATERRRYLGTDAIAVLEAHSWPGNVRELRHVVARALAIAEGEFIGAADVHLDTAGAPEASNVAPRQGRPKPRSDVADAATMAAWEAEERERIRSALSAADGNRSRAARMLGLSRDTLTRRIAELGLGKSQ